MRHQFTDSGVKAVIIAEMFAHNLEKILGDTHIKTIITASVGEMLGAVKGRITNFVVRTVKGLVPKFSLPNVVKFNDALSQGKKFTLTPHKGGANDTIIHQYTGGTTGVAKGAMLTNRNLISNMQQIRALMDVALVDGKEIALSPLPMYHIFAFTVNCLALMSRGALNVIITNARDLGSIVDAFKKYEISVMTGVNTLFNALLNNEDFKKLEFSKMKIVVGGGMAVQRAVAEEWHRITGCPLTEGYGMTEASPVISCNPIDGSGKISTIGMPLPSTDVKIVDDEGNTLGFNEVGELWAKGPQVMKGYYNRPAETAKTITDGWLHTGDIAKMHEDGYFQIVDRKKDMILVSGFNVFPNEVEDVIAAHPKVLEVAAIGKEDAKSGEVVKVFVVKKDTSLTEKELIAYCKENMTGYKVPKAIEWREELPKTNVGKILRRVLKEEEKAKS